MELAGNPYLQYIKFRHFLYSPMFGGIGGIEGTEGTPIPDFPWIISMSPSPSLSKELEELKEVQQYLSCPTLRCLQSLLL